MSQGNFDLWIVALGGLFAAMAGVLHASAPTIKCLLLAVAP